MERRPFGSTGVQVPVIGQGTWQLRTRQPAIAALRAGLDLGMTHLDTAELYRGAEEVVRTASEGRPRDDVFLVSKVLPRHASYEGVLKACRASLDRLGTDHLDVYLLHWPSEEPIAETMRAFGELLDRGWTRWVGVSNFDVEGLQEAQAALGAKGKLVCNQVRYHLMERDIEAALIPYCAREGIAVVAYSPFGGGYRAFPTKGPQRQVLDEVGRKHGKTARQVALRFLSREDHVFTIPKSEDVAHTTENAGGQGWRLDREDLAALDRAFPPPAQRGLAQFSG